MRFRLFVRSRHVECKIGQEGARPPDRAEIFRPPTSAVETTRIIHTAHDQMITADSSQIVRETEIERLSFVDK